MKLETPSVTHSAKISSSIVQKSSLSETRAASYMVLKHRNKMINRSISDQQKEEITSFRVLWTWKLHSCTCCGSLSGSESFYFAHASLINTALASLYKLYKENLHFVTINAYQNHFFQQIHERTMNNAMLLLGNEWPIHLQE